MEQNSNVERVFEWDDIIQNDSPDYVVLPEGDYEFTVLKMERKRFTPGPNAKLPPCNQADILLQIAAPNGDISTFTHSLFLHSKCEGMLCAFFTAIGQRKHGEALKMNWAKVPGSRGKCKVGVHTYTKKDGTQGQSNEIKKFYEPEEEVPIQKSFTPGAF